MDGLKGGNCTSVAVHVCPSLLSQRCVSLYLVKATWSSGSETFLPLHLLAFQIFDVDGVWSQTWLISLVICFGPVTNLVVRHTLAATSFSVVQDAHLTLKLVTHRPHASAQHNSCEIQRAGACIVCSEHEFKARSCGAPWNQTLGMCRCDELSKPKTGVVPVLF